MSSSAVELVAEQRRCGDDGNGGETVENGELDHLLLLRTSSEPSAPTISLPTETFLKAATLLKNQVRMIRTRRHRLLT